MNILVIIGVIVAIVGVILIVLINQYNKFQWYNTLLDKGENNLINSLSRKFDILLRFLDFLKNNKVEVKEDELEDYKLLNTKQPINKLNKKVDELNNIVNKYMDNNEKLLKNETIIKLNKELSEANISINGGKKYYNDNLTIYNHLCNAFPSKIVAKLKKYKEKNFVDGEIKEELKILEE